MHIARIGGGSVEQPAADMIGSKAANLARMAALGLPVPPAFVLPIDLCAAVVAGESEAHAAVGNALRDGIAFLEQTTGRKFGDKRNPLLGSVRSGAARSMPGMLDTVLDVGCAPAAVDGLIRMSGHAHFAWDCRRRFIESFAHVVLRLDPAPFARKLDELIAAEHAGGEHGLDSEALERLSAEYRQIVEGEDDVLPDDPMQQLEAAAHAVYRSWMSPRAMTYRKLQGLDDLKGTAVTVQAMVYGNRNFRSGSGVAFSRDPSTGADGPVIDVLFAAQGEDVVSGQRTPDNEAALGRRLPDVARQLREVLGLLERDFADVQDVEFTIEDGKLWVLQTRAAKRTPRAALRIAIDLVHEGLIDKEEALRRLGSVPFERLARQHLNDVGSPAACGISASPGIAVGRAAFNSERAVALAESGAPVILLRPDTSTADVAGFSAAAGIVTAVGGHTAHAALVARQMGKPCVVGCATLTVDTNGQGARLGETPIKEGDWLSIEGETGAIYLGRGTVITEQAEAELAEIESWRSKVA